MCTLATYEASQPTVRTARGILSARREHSKNACALAEWLKLNCCWADITWGDFTPIPCAAGLGATLRQLGRLKPSARMMLAVCLFLLCCVILHLLLLLLLLLLLSRLWLGILGFRVGVVLGISTTRRGVQCSLPFRTTTRTEIQRSIGCSSSMPRQHGSSHAKP